MSETRGYALPCPFALSRRFFELDVQGQPHPYFLLTAVCATRRRPPLREAVPAGACWHERIDEEWEAWINPHAAIPARFQMERTGGDWVMAPPGTAWIGYRGWLWALVAPAHGFYLDPPAPPTMTREEGAGALRTDDGESLDAIEAFALACFRVLLPPLPVNDPIGDARR